MRVRLFKSLPRRLGTLAIFVAGLFFLVLGLGGHLQLLEARQLKAEGRPAEGTVTGLHASRKGSNYHFSYEFRAGGVTHARKDRGISYGDYHGLRQGTRVNVWYDPADPAKSITTQEMAELESWPNRLFLPVLALALLGWGIGRIVRKRPAAPAPPAAPSAAPARPPQVNPVRRGE